MLLLSDLFQFDSLLSNLFAIEIFSTVNVVTY